MAASGSYDYTVKLWDAESGKLRWTLDGHQHWVNSLVFDPSGTIVASGSYDKTVKLWDMDKGTLLRTLDGHQNVVTSVAFDPSGRMVASGSSDHTVKLWDAASGRFLGSLEGHLGSVDSVAFAPNGKYLAAGGSAGRLQLWDLERQETFLSLYAFGPGAWLALLPDGRFDGSPDGIRYLCYTERGTFNSVTADEVVKEFYDPKAVREVMARYGAPQPA
jgi:predicted NACHT family NTPase